MTRRNCLQGLALLPGVPLLAAARPARAAAADPLPLTTTDFTLEDIDGHTHSLSHYRGQVVLLNFWASWCPPCRAEMPSIERLYQALSKRRLVVLGINQGESVETAFASLGLFSPAPTFPILLDRKGAVAKAYGVQALPSSFVINRDGRVVAKADGARNFSAPAMLQYMEKLLA